MTSSSKNENSISGARKNMRVAAKPRSSPGFISFKRIASGYFSRFSIRMIGLATAFQCSVNMSSTHAQMNLCKTMAKEAVLVELIYDC